MLYHLLLLYHVIAWKMTFLKAFMLFFSSAPAYVRMQECYGWGKICRKFEWRLMSNAFFVEKVCFFVQKSVFAISYFVEIDTSTYFAWQDSNSRSRWLNKTKRHLVRTRLCTAMFISNCCEHWERKKYTLDRNNESWNGTKCRILTLSNRRCILVKKHCYYYTKLV